MRHARSRLGCAAGATGLSDRIVSVQVELPSLGIYDGLPSLSEAIAEVSSHGFDPVAFFPVGFDRDGLRPIEFDGLFIRTTHRSRGTRR